MGLEPSKFGSLISNLLLPGGVIAVPFLFKEAGMDDTVFHNLFIAIATCHDVEWHGTVVGDNVIPPFAHCFPPFPHPLLKGEDVYYAGMER